MNEKSKKLADIAKRIEGFTASPLFSYRVQNGYRTVPGEGTANAKVFFIGEAPGLKEAESGRPFVGQSGKLLSELLVSIGLTREEVFITSILKDRPPGNRDPKPIEIQMYAPFLLEQIGVIRPKVLVPLGRHSLGFLLEYFALPEAGQVISSLHGKALLVDKSRGGFTIFPMYHPAAALYNPKLKEVLQKDFQELSVII